MTPVREATVWRRRQGLAPQAPAAERVETVGTTITESADDDLKSMSVEELNKLLNEVLESEDYMRAIAIRDELNSRKSQ